MYDKKAHPLDKVMFTPAVSRVRSRKLHHPWKGPLICSGLGSPHARSSQARIAGNVKLYIFDRLKPCAPRSYHRLRQTEGS